jgi:hypothetical protein
MTKAPFARIERKMKLDGKWTFATIASKVDRRLWDFLVARPRLGGGDREAGAECWQWLRA